MQGPRHRNRADGSGARILPPMVDSYPNAVPARPDAFDEASFWTKLGRFASRIGRAGVEQALTLYFTMRDADTPRRAKATIAGALGYLIVPIDAVPDFLAGVGYGDDFTALALAAGVVAAHVKKEHRALAAARVAAWFRRGRGLPPS